MFGLSFTHLVILAILTLVFVGPEQLPEVARTIARLLNEWKRASSDIQNSLTSTLRDDLNIAKMIDPKDPKFEKQIEPPPPVDQVSQPLAPHAANAHQTPATPEDPEKKS